MFRKPTTQNGPLLATTMGVIEEFAPEHEIREPEEGVLEAPLVELAIGVGVVLVATLIAWILVKATAPGPLVTMSPEAGAVLCVEGCAVEPARTDAVLPKEWRWEPQAYSFDEIYGQPEPPVAYSFDFVYRPPPTTLR